MQTSCLLETTLPQARSESNQKAVKLEGKFRKKAKGGKGSSSKASLRTRQGKFAVALGCAS